MSPVTSLIGQRFGRLTVEHREHSMKRAARWRCRCDCGAISVVFGKNLRKGNTKSCGCLRRDSARRTHLKHGYSRHGWKHPLYRTWWGMIQRCTNRNEDSYQYYGGRGIKVSKRWRDDVVAFIADVGPKPSHSHSLDRIDPDGDYEPGNVRWATAVEQRNNRRRN